MLISNGLRLIFFCLLFLAQPISFHCLRHSCAVLLLTLGADIYTVSKILGHRSVRATQVYAKIVDKKKDDAITLVDDAF